MLVFPKACFTPEKPHDFRKLSVLLWTLTTIVVVSKLFYKSYFSDNLFTEYFNVR